MLEDFIVLTACFGWKERFKANDPKYSLEKLEK